MEVASSRPVTYRHCLQPKLPNFIYSSNVKSWRLMRRANNNNNDFYICRQHRSLTSKTELRFFFFFFFYIRIDRQYTTEEGHRRVRKLWSFYFIGLKCHNYAIYLCFVYKQSNTRKPSYVTFSRIMIHIYIYIREFILHLCLLVN